MADRREYDPRFYRQLRRQGWTASRALLEARLERELELLEAAGLVSVEIVPDGEYDPRTAVDWSDAETDAYVQRFQRGELEAYGVIVKVGNVAEASVWGVDVETGTEWSRDGYCRETARELYSELVRPVYRPASSSSS